LDVTIQAQVLSMIRELQQRLETSMIMITHDLGIVAKTCDHVAIMYAGELIETGTAEDIFCNQNHHPYTEGLFGSIPNLKEHSKRLNPIPGLMPDPSIPITGCSFADRCPKVMAICKTTHPSDYYLGTHRIKCHLFTDYVISDQAKEGCR
jgi:peptide/nickel transport system ATP-binding protein